MCKERIADQTRRAFHGDAWHGPAVAELLAGVEAPIAAAHPVANAHSIWEIVLHIQAWKDTVCRRMAGEAVELTREEDWPPVRDVGEDAWVCALDELRFAQHRLERALAAFPEERLGQTVPGKDYDFHFMLEGAIQHDLYHAGQIALLKRA